MLDWSPSLRSSESLVIISGFASFAFDEYIGNPGGPQEFRHSASFHDGENPIPVAKRRNPWLGHSV